MKTTIRLFVTILAFICLTGMVQKAQAVVPAPDGGYPNFTTAEGTNALKNLTNGTANTAAGWFSLFTNSTASFNTALGAGTLLFNNADQNTALGAAALLFNTTGSFNTAVGAVALLNNDDGSSNTAVGTSALQSNTHGGFNTAIGFGALDLNTTGFGNTALGASALQANIGGIDNTAVGGSALGANTGNSNTAVGFIALQNNTTGSGNIAIGTEAGDSITTANNVICIGATFSGENVSNSCYIDNIFNATSSSGSAVFVNAAGKLGTSTSSSRFKDDIKPMDEASEALFALNPVSFRYKKEIDPVRTSQLGLVAEDVEKVNPDLVVRDKEGKPYSVRYDQVNAMLLNEFLKEHRKVEKLEATVADLAEQLQKITAQVQMKNSSARVAGK
jgi:hypothetical protein